MNTNQTSRRKFLSESSKLIAGASMFSAPLIASAKNKITTANEKIVVGLIGARNMSFANLSDMPEFLLRFRCHI